MKNGSNSKSLAENLRLDREGYSNSFLHKTIELPINRGIIEKSLIIDSKASDSIDRYFLKYHHFSILMNKKRKLALYTACNIDGSKLKDSDDGILRNQEWRFDPRIEDTSQIGNEVYKDNPLDRGHLVRRLDPVWGSLEEAKLANKDTFFYTNCCPQHEKFNRLPWVDLEDLILNKAEIESSRLSVFTGPIFNDNDRIYTTVKIPNEFWKIVIGKDKLKNEFTATAYLLSQKNLIDTLKTFSPEEAKTYQVPIKRIVEVTGINFKELIQYDPMDRYKVFGKDFRVIKDISDILL
ncbi:MAG: DNA/RNA non-specific endonuclease [Promethearchaeota archaeon]